MEHALFRLMITDRNLLDLVTLTILSDATHFEVPHCGAFSTPHPHPSWAQIFSLGSCFQIPLTTFAIA